MEDLFKTIETEMVAAAPPPTMPPPPPPLPLLQPAAPAGAATDASEPASIPTVELPALTAAELKKLTAGKGAAAAEALRSELAAGLAVVEARQEKGWEERVRAIKLAGRLEDWREGLLPSSSFVRRVREAAAAVRAEEDQEEEGEMEKEEGATPMVTDEVEAEAAVTSEKKKGKKGRAAAVEAAAAAAADARPPAEAAPIATAPPPPPIPPAPSATAQEGKAEKEKWAKLVRRYFDSRPLPPLVLHLVDFRHGFLERDLELSEWLSGMRVGELPVFTKIDKISRGARRATLEKYLKNLSIPEQNCILTSSEDNSGIEELRTLIENYGRSA